MTAHSRILNAFTVDVEDYYHVSAFARKIHPTQWDHFPSRVVANTHRILDILERHSVQGTFFVLGWVARKFPDLVRDIRRGGHEIGCHSFWHRLIYDLDPDEFRGDLRESRDQLEQITGEAVLSHRAPSFSITEQSLWALQILAEEGFTIDSSIFPVRHDRYGLKGAERFAHRIDTDRGGIWEFPPAVYRLWKWHLPVSGGGYFRLYPARFSAFCLQQSNQGHHRPFVFYIHPWEVDPDQPRIAVRAATRFRHYVNLSKTEQKLDVLFDRFAFGKLSDSLEEYERGLQSLGQHVKRIDYRNVLRGPVGAQIPHRSRSLPAERREAAAVERNEVPS